jgi:hypothetical protein
MHSHIEIHWCETARDAERLAHAGLPRLDLEPQRCTACNARVGEVNGSNGTVFWKPCGLVLNENDMGVVCKRCFARIDKALQAR